MNNNEQNVIKNKNEAIKKFSDYLDNCIVKDEKHLKKANLISYWLKDYANYIEQEENFNSNLLKEYHRGDIIKVNLGFNIGNEEGGLHYCVVLDKKNAKSYSTLTIIPLSSIKQSSQPRKTNVFLGNDIYISLENKYKALYKESTEELYKAQNEFKELKKSPTDTEMDLIVLEYKQNIINKKIEEINNKLDLLEKINKELSQMKTGTLALINQITTISKQRIYNPKKDIDILSGVQLSTEKMNLIDEAIKKLYLN